MAHGMHGKVTLVSNTQDQLLPCAGMNYHLHPYVHPVNMAAVYAIKDWGLARPLPIAILFK
jgi:hypothetical protein